MSTTAPAAAPTTIAAVRVLLGAVVPVIAGVVLAEGMGIDDVAAGLEPNAGVTLRQDVSSPAATENIGDVA